MTKEQIKKAAENHDNYPDKYAYNKAGFIAGAKYYAEHQWISVDDELPEKNSICLVLINNKIPHIIIFDDKWEIGRNTYNITHWMEIPKLNKD